MMYCTCDRSSASSVKPVWLHTDYTVKGLVCCLCQSVVHSLFCKAERHLYEMQRELCDAIAALQRAHESRSNQRRKVSEPAKHNVDFKLTTHLKPKQRLHCLLGQILDKLLSDHGWHMLNTCTDLALASAALTLESSPRFITLILWEQSSKCKLKIRHQTSYENHTPTGLFQCCIILVHVLLWQNDI